MSMSSQVFVGYFIKAKLSSAHQTDEVFVCTHNHNHKYGHPVPRFCPECGSEMDWVKVGSDLPISMWDLQCGAEYDWIKQLDPVDVAWINEMFSASCAYSVDGEDGYDYIMCKGYDDVDGIEPGVHAMSVSEITTPPTLVDIKRVQHLLCYETTELLFGALVSVSY